MREGFFAVYYTGKSGSGLGLIALSNGTIVGVDVAGGLYDGVYVSENDSEPLTGKLNLTVPANTALVTGSVPESKPSSLEFPLDLAGNFADVGTPHLIRTSKGSVNVIFKKLRDLDFKGASDE